MAGYLEVGDNLEEDKGNSEDLDPCKADLVGIVDTPLVHVGLFDYDIDWDSTYIQAEADRSQKLVGQLDILVDFHLRLEVMVLSSSSPLDNLSRASKSKPSLYQHV